MEHSNDCYPIKASIWEDWIAFKTDQYHKAPRLSPGTTPATATQAVWGTGDNEICYVKQEEANLLSQGRVVLTKCKSAADANRQYKKLLAFSNHAVKDDIKQVQKVYRPTLFGGPKEKDLIYGSVYLNKDEKDLSNSDVEGVIHNPNYPGVDGGKYFSIAGSCTYVRALSYCLAGAISAGVTAWLLRRSLR